MSSRPLAARRVNLSLGAALACQLVTTGCSAPAEPAPPATARAELTVTYRGERLSHARVLANLGEEVRIETLTDDGHDAAVRLRIVAAAAGAYRTSVDLRIDGAEVGATDFLSTPGQSVASESPDLKLALRVQPGE